MQDVGKEYMQEKYWITTQTMWSFHRWLFRWLGVVLVGFTMGLSMAGCGSENPWNLVPSAGDSCDVYKQLRDNALYRQTSPFDDPNQADAYTKDPGLRSPYRTLFSQSQELGCLILYRTDSQDKFITYQLTHVALTDKGEIKGFDTTTQQYTVGVRWKLSPEQLKGVPLTLALYVLRSDQLGNKSHEQYCKDILQKRPNCFPQDQNQKGDCWFWMQLSPKIPQDSPFALGGNQGTCKICSREICGNNIDDDCNGKVDDGCGTEDCHHLDRTRPCYTGPANTRNVGICKEGKQTCRDAKDATRPGALKWSVCEGEILAKQEVCNGVDDNCDGQTDEGIANCCTVGELRPCYSGDAKNAGQGICVRGVEQCILDEQTRGGKWGLCEGDVKPAIEVCDGLDNDCNGQIDDGLPTKDCKTSQVGECEAGQEQCKDGKISCLPKKTPQPELCNGKDDDCDGQIDELFPQRGQPCKVDGALGPCAEGIQIACQAGKVVCQALYQAEPAERCNDGIDNDCNGKVDEQDTTVCACKAGEKRPCYPGDPATRGKGECKDGEQTCLVSGQWGSCVGAVVPSPEICDGKDNNCNGTIDETFPTQGQLCFIVTGGAQGPCSYGRLDSCGASPDYKPVCKAIYQATTAEICNNGIDDDCDGVIDNSPPCDCRQSTSTSDPKVQDCSKMPKSLWNTGICKPGSQTCNFNGVWSGCLNETPPSLETCDGKDNDCNGQTDEADPQLNTACQLQQNQGVCQEGTNQCQNGALVCVAKVTQPPQLDLCNGLDDDCNGKIDDSDPDIGKACAVHGKQGECAKGTVSCVNGNHACQSTITPQTEQCNGLDDDCNGKIDDNLSAPPCNTNLKGVCAQATKLCGGIKGWQDCEAGDFFRTSTLYQEKETLCDGKDNDCDGQIDTDGQGQALTRPCYDTSDGKPGPAGTQNVGTCRSGTSTCAGGQWGACQNSVFPAEKKCEGSIDNDCNGIPDKDESTCRCTDEIAKGEVVIRTWGTGTDGTLLINNKVVLDKVPGNQLDRTPALSRTTPDITYHEVTGIGTQDITVKNATGLQDGDEVMLIHVQGNEQRIGTYELFFLQKLENNKLLLRSKITQIYGNSDNTALDGQKIQLIRVPQYRRVTVTSNGELTVSGWNGQVGGILVFRAQELVRVSPGGKISTQALGYRGGASVAGNTETARGGESIKGQPSDEKGQQGGGFAGIGSTKAQSGGGGGYGSQGQPGLDQDGQSAATGGLTLGSEKLNRQIMLGSGGGAGGTDTSAKGTDTKNTTGAGGLGGGVLFIITRTLNVAGSLSANGDPGQNAVSFGGALGGGGGGSGGSIHIHAFHLQLYDGAIISAQGGKGGLSAADGPTQTKQPFNKSVGGQGGEGRIDIRLRQLNGKDATSDVGSFSVWVAPKPYVQPLNPQCVAPPVVPTP